VGNFLGLRKIGEREPVNPFDILASCGHAQFSQSPGVVKDEVPVSVAFEGLNVAELEITRGEAGLIVQDPASRFLGVFGVAKVIVRKEPSLFAIVS
jgi:hypothetical protein